jgi:hypothetical protein
MIREKENINSIASGNLIVGYRDAVTDVFTPVVEQNNLITYGGADIMAKLLSGDTRYVINGMYFQFKNSSDHTGQTIDRTNKASYFHTLTGANTDWLRVPILTSGGISRSPIESVAYAGNSVTFVATTAAVGSTGQSPEGSTFSQSSSSKIFSLALVSMPYKDDTLKIHDIVFSRADLANSIPAIDNSYIDVFWTISFT